MLNVVESVDVGAFAKDFNRICAKHHVPLKMWDDGDVTYTDWSAWKEGTGARLSSRGNHALQPSLH